MTFSLLWRGLLAGLSVFGFARIAGEPEVERAIAFESAMSAMGHDDQPELVSRDTQCAIGLFTGIVALSTALGGLFGLFFAVSMERLGRKHLGSRPLAALLALLGFTALRLVPDLTYRANPGLVGHADTHSTASRIVFPDVAGVGR